MPAHTHQRGLRTDTAGGRHRLHPRARTWDASESCQLSERALSWGMSKRRGRAERAANAAVRTDTTARISADATDEWHATDSTGSHAIYGADPDDDDATNSRCNGHSAAPFR